VPGAWSPSAAPKKRFQIRPAAANGQCVKHPETLELISQAEAMSNVSLSALLRPNSSRESTLKTPVNTSVLDVKSVGPGAVHKCKKTAIDSRTRAFLKQSPGHLASRVLHLLLRRRQCTLDAVPTDATLTYCNAVLDFYVPS
jgi:hypothetical protein